MSQIASVAGARKEKGERKPKYDTPVRRDAEGGTEAELDAGRGTEAPLPLSLALHVLHTPNFPLSLPLSSACHAGYVKQYSLLTSSFTFRAVSSTIGGWIGKTAYN